MSENHKLLETDRSRYMENKNAEYLKNTINKVDLISRLKILFLKRACTFL